MINSENDVIYTTQSLIKEAFALPDCSYSVIPCNKAEELGKALFILSELEELHLGRRLKTSEVMIDRAFMTEGEVKREKLVDSCDRLYLAIFDKFPNLSDLTIQSTTLSNAEYCFVSNEAISDFKCALQSFAD